MRSWGAEHQIRSQMPNLQMSESNPGSCLPILCANTEFHDPGVESSALVLDQSLRVRLGPD